MPSRASRVTNIALKLEYAVAAPFHSERTPARVERRCTFAVAMSESASPVCLVSQPRRLAMPATVPNPVA
jgi:hypothetical protein